MQVYLVRNKRRHADRTRPIRPRHHMPRLLPKLIPRVQAARYRDTPSSQPFQPRKPVKTVQDNHKPPLRANFSPHGRKRSILLDETNPINDVEAYTYSKRRRPLIPMVTETQRKKDPTRLEMTDVECQFWANPYRKRPPLHLICE